MRSCSNMIFKGLILCHNLVSFRSVVGLSISFRQQKIPTGIPEAFTLCSDFIGKERVTLILGDNIFFGDELANMISSLSELHERASILAYQVNDPQRYGVVNFDNHGKIKSLEEKPLKPKSKYAITGVYFVDHEAIEFTKSLIPSARGELEIIDVLNQYFQNNKLDVQIMGRGMAWLDTGTHFSLLEASQFISVLEKRQGLKIGCLEEIAFSKKWIDEEQILASAKLYNNEYGEYLRNLIKP